MHYYHEIFSDFPQGMKAVVSAIVKDDHLFSEAVGKDEFGILLNKTMFYGECGGQIADKGCIKTNVSVGIIS